MNDVFISVYICPSARFRNGWKSYTKVEKFFKNNRILLEKNFYLCHCKQKLKYYGHLLESRQRRLSKHIVKKNLCR